MPTVLALQHIACEPLGAIEDVLRTQGYNVRYVRSYAGESVPRTLDGYCGLVVMGGPMGVNEADRYPFLKDEIGLIERVAGGSKPVLGVCLGSQLIATALGAQVRTGERPEIGWLPVTLSDAGKTDTLWQGVPETFVPLHWHGDVFDVPSAATSLASSAQTACQSFRFGDNVYAVLFHMEVTPAIVGGWVGAFPEELANAGLAPSAIEAGVRAHLAKLNEIATGFFQRWSRLLPRES